MLATATGSPDPQAVLQRFVTSHIAQQANHWSGRNVVRWSHAEYDRLWAQAAAELDPAARAALLIRMNDLLIEEVVIIPVVWRHGVRMSHETKRTIFDGSGRQMPCHGASARPPHVTSGIVPRFSWHLDRVQDCRHGLGRQAEPGGDLRQVCVPVHPENLKLFANLTFLGFIRMLDQRTSPSSDTPV